MRVYPMKKVLLKAISIGAWLLSVMFLAMAVIAFSGHPAPFVIWLAELLRGVAGVGAPLLAMGVLVALVGLLIAVGAKTWKAAGRVSDQSVRHW